MSDEENKKDLQNMTEEEKREYYKNLYESLSDLITELEELLDNGKK